MTNNAIIINPPEPATASVIWLHGLGANGHDFEPIVPELSPDYTRYTRFIFPHAPNRPITINGGMVMRGWYDIVKMDITERQDRAGTDDSQRIIEALLAAEYEQGISSERIVIAGFSQGGAIALHTGLRHPQRLAGILALSTYLPFAESVATERHPANQTTPIFMGHGKFDQIIPLIAAEESKRILTTLGYSVAYHTYMMEHSVSATELIDIDAWLKKVLPKC